MLIQICINQKLFLLQFRRQYTSNQHTRVIYCITNVTILLLLFFNLKCEIIYSQSHPRSNSNVYCTRSILYPCHVKPHGNKAVNYRLLRCPGINKHVVVMESLAWSYSIFAVVSPNRTVELCKLLSIATVLIQFVRIKARIMCVFWLCRRFN